MRRHLPALAPLLLLAACAASPPSSPPAQTAGLRLVDTDGHPQDLDAALARDEAVAFVVWQTWCHSCASEAPAIAEAARRHGGRLRFVGVIPGKDADVDPAEVASVRSAWGYAFPQVRDPDLSLCKRLGVKGTPTIVVLGRGGAVRYDGHRAPADWAALEGAPVASVSSCEGGVCPLPERP
jgi:thiol-disulfide isomerase/thioredoxin